jgi:hypothetical protein
LKRKADFIINLKDCSDRVQSNQDGLNSKVVRSKICINDAYNGIVNIGIECNREWLQHQIHLLTKSALIEMRICNRVIIERAFYKKNVRNLKSALKAWF